MRYGFRRFKLLSYLFIVLTGLILIDCGGSDSSGGAMELAKLIPDEYSGWKAVGNVEQYNRRTIFDYINGAGEVYLLYDFKDVIVKRLVGTGSTGITVEIFDMSRPEDAFGIFSHSRGGNDIGVGADSEFRDGFLCFWKNRYFVCVYSDKQSEKINNTVIGIGKEIESEIPGDSRKPSILNVLPDDGLAESSVIYFHKQASLNYHYFLAEENILNLDEHTEAVIANYRSGRSTLLCVKYLDSGIASRSFDNFVSKYIPEASGTGLAQTENDRWVKALNFSNYFIAVLDAPDENAAKMLANQVKEKISRVGDE